MPKDLTLSCEELAAAVFLADVEWRPHLIAWLTQWLDVDPPNWKAIAELAKKTIKGQITRRSMPYQADIDRNREMFYRRIFQRISKVHGMPCRQAILNLGFSARDLRSLMYDTFGPSQVLSAWIEMMHDENSVLPRNVASAPAVSAPTPVSSAPAPQNELMHGCIASDVPCGDDDDACVICLENRAVVALAPCGHMITCVACTRGLEKKECPTCRGAVTSALRVFK